MLKGYDIDGVLTNGILPTGNYVVISGRTISEYDSVCADLAKHVPVYVRYSGIRGDRKHAGEFKSAIINMLGVNEFFEDDVIQIEIIKKLCPDCVVHHIK